MMRPAILSNASLHAVIRRAHLRMAWVSITLAGVLLLLVGLVVLRLYLANNLQLMARSVAYTVEASVVFADRAEAGRVLDDMLRHEGIAQARVVEADGQVFAEWLPPEPEASARVGEWLAAGLRLPPGSAEIRQAGRLIGEVQLRSDGAGLARFLGTGLVALLLCQGISGYVGLRLSRRMLADIAEPLGELARVARAVRHDRSMEQRVPPARIAELRELGDDFNALMAELQLRHLRLQQQNSLLAQQAMSDSLTGLANRAHFEQGLQRALDEAMELDQMVAVLFVDADRFKEVNDRLGHAAGDCLLKALGERLRQQVRETDLVARVGGDEFAVLLHPVRGAGDVQPVIEKIVAAMKPPILTENGDRLYPAVSVGMAVYPEHGADMQALLAHADRAMYEDKARRREVGAHTFKEA
ncbi:MAG: diguanylate cyclase domain-containing protein [Comamonas sp.]